MNPEELTGHKSAMLTYPWNSSLPYSSVSSRWRRREPSSQHLHHKADLDTSHHPVPRPQPQWSVSGHKNKHIHHQSADTSKTQAVMSVGYERHVKYWIIKTTAIEVQSRRHWKYQLYPQNEIIPSTETKIGQELTPSFCCSCHMTLIMWYCHTTEQHLTNDVRHSRHCWNNNNKTKNNFLRSLMKKYGSSKII